MPRPYTSRVSQSFRLPLEVAETLETLAGQRGVSKTDVVAEAIIALGRRQTDELMTEGMLGASESRTETDALATAGLEVVDEW